MTGSAPGRKSIEESVGIVHHSICKSVHQVGAAKQVALFELQSGRTHRACGLIPLATER